MEKLAIFVEGQTEEIFVTRLIEHIANSRDVHIDSVRAFGGGAAGDRVFNEVKATQRPDPNKKYYVVIYNSEGYSRVLSDIIDRHGGLCSEGYKLIIGMRDVIPQTHADIPAIRSNFDILAPKRPVRPLLVLATMEIETWFIAETYHYPEIDARLKLPAAIAALGFDPDLVDVELRMDPAGDLRRAYMSVGKGYNKSRRHAERTVHVLSYEAIYLLLRERFSDLANLITYLYGFFS